MVRVVSMAMADWPTSDLAMWAGLLKQAGPLDGNGGLSHVRAATEFSLRCAYERWLAWLALAEPAALLEPPEQRATPERLVAWFNAMAHLAMRSRFSYVDRTVRILSVADLEADWSIQHHLLNGLRRRAKRTASTRKTGRILSSRVLLSAGRALAGPHADAAAKPLAAAHLRRNGTMVAFLALMPIRCRSLSELKLSQSVLVTPGRIIISLSGDMTKNGLPWESAVPDAIEPMLRSYIESVRPFLLARRNAQHDMLWVGQLGEPLLYGTFGVTIVKATFRMTGVRIPPHFFRDSAASTLARQSPGDARLICVAAHKVSAEALRLTAPFTLRRRGNELRIIAGSLKPAPDPTLRRMLAKAQRWIQDLQAGTALCEIARRDGHADSYVRTRGQLAFLSPRIQIAIPDGTQPPDLSVERILRIGIPLDWREQEQVFGFQNT